jgi:hypothetical protein
MAQTLKFGKGTWATKKGSTLSYNDESNNYKPLPFTTTRSSSATRVNKEGLIEVVENDRPRIDYTDSSNGVLLLEKAATNLVTQSEDFSDGDWSKNSGATISSNQIISPDGTLNADELIVSTSAAGIYDGQGGTGTYTFSVFAKYKDIRYLRMRSTGGYAYFDLINGTYSGLIGLSDITSEDYGNGWFRFSITTNLTNSLVQFFLSNNGTGNPTGTGSAYLWGAQFEASSFVTSYIPTSGSTATRVADTASGAGNSEVFNDSQGVLFANIAALVNDSTNRIISVSDGSGSNRILVKYDNSSNTIQGSCTASTDQAELSFNTDITLNYKVAFKYKANDFSLFVNGFEVDTDATGTTPSGLDTLNFDNGSGGSDFYGKTKEIGYYDTALTDLELEKLTSYVSLSEMATELNYKAL